MNTKLTFDIIRYLKGQKKEIAKETDVINFFNETAEELYGNKTITYQGKEKNVLELFNEQVASTMFHQAYAGGLREHCFNVYIALLDRCSNERAIKVDLTIKECARLAILHDLCKVPLYSYDKKQQKYTYDPEWTKHHGTGSITLAWQLNIELSVKEKAIIRHHMNGWDNPEDYELEPRKEYLWRQKHELEIRVFNWADMKDNIPNKVFAIVDDKGQVLGLYQSERYAETLLKKNQTLKEMRII